MPVATPGPSRGPEAAGKGRDAPLGEVEAGQRTWNSGEATSVLSTQVLGCEPPASSLTGGQWCSPEQALALVAT